MSEDWAAVAKAINERVNELGWLQRELAKRSHVSQAIVREIQHHVVERRRSPRTLESLSVTLGWRPQHLDAVLHGRRPPEPDEPGRRRRHAVDPPGRARTAHDRDQRPLGRPESRSQYGDRTCPHDAVDPCCWACLAGFLACRPLQCESGRNPMRRRCTFSAGVVQVQCITAFPGSVRDGVDDRLDRPHRVRAAGRSAAQ